jgi:tripartite-type tricarboxylate transporter receptor subunit TctC
MIRSHWALALAAILISLVPASAQEAAPFYQGKTLRIIVGYSPGGGYDTNARILARFIGAHIPGNPNVVVENMPGASSLKSVQYLEAAPKDGTVITAFSAGLIVQSLTEPQTFSVKLTDYSWVGSIAQEVRICYVRPALGIKTFSELQKVPSISFGETGSGSAGFVDQNIMRSILKVNLKTIIGYPGSSDKVLAIQRAELDGDCGSFSSIPKEQITNRQINIIYRSTEAVLPGLPRETPYIMDLIQKEEDKELVRFLLVPTIVGRPYMASQQIPKDRLAILRKAFDETVNDPDFQRAAEQAELPVAGPMTGEQASAFVADIYRTPPDVIARAKAMFGTSK